jgi:uncharacterized protein (DUF302 family)
MIFKPFISAIFSLFLMASNGDDQNEAKDRSSVGAGLQYSISDLSNLETYNAIVIALEENENIGIVAQVNHSMNAQNAGLMLRETRTVLFGNPNLGTPLMQENQLAGLDLPQKIAVYTTATDEVFAVYNSVDYLAARHGLTSPSLSTISNALETLTTSATQNEVFAVGTNLPLAGQGIITVQSTQDFDSTYDSLVQAIEGNTNLILVAELDHKANAESVGMSLNPTRLVIFGNPDLGTPLMQSSQSVSIDLPQKMLVWEDDNGDVFISYNDPAYLAERHAIFDRNEQLEMISTALANLANAADGE